VIRFADDEVPAAAPEQTPAVPVAAATAVSASSAPTAAPASASISPSAGSTPKVPDSRRDKDEENLSVEAAPVAPKPTTLQQKMLAMAGQDIDQFMREVSYVIFLILRMAST
jgi:WW domain-binding protein 11